MITNYDTELRFRNAYLNMHGLKGIDVFFLFFQGPVFLRAYQSHRCDYPIVATSSINPMLSLGLSHTLSPTLSLHLIHHSCFKVSPGETVSLAPLLQQPPPMPEHKWISLALPPHCSGLNSWAAPPHNNRS